VDEIEHPIFREALRSAALGPDAALEIASMADIPAGTGLGSSGSFTTALLKALHTHRRNLIHPAELAEEACDIEMNRLGDPVGKQDPYIAAFGGLTCFHFCPRGRVSVSPLRISNDTRHTLEDNLLLFFTGYSRSAAAILRDQDTRTKTMDHEMLDNLHFVKELGYASQQALESSDLREFARLMDVHWDHKKRRSPGMSNGEIDSMYRYAMENGALGGKLIGAGGGGFLMFYTEENARLRRAMRECGLAEVPFRFDSEGTRVIAQ
jgi:D-glycero-alpha-D-manno-heptose-7-phosphate kinase